MMLLDSVNSAPDVKDSLTTVAVRRGTRAELPCVASAFPLPRYSWTKDETAVGADGGRFQQLDGNLVIDGATVADGGEYLCTAENSLGRKSIIVKLIVTGQQTSDFVIRTYL